MSVSGPKDSVDVSIDLFEKTYQKAELNNLGENVCLNRGFKLRAFCKIADVEEWLLS